MPKYSDNLNRVLANDLYFNIFEKKGVKYLKISDVNIESPISLNVIGFKISNQF